MSLLQLYCHVDDFCQQVEPQLETQRLQDAMRHRRRVGELCSSEIMTILIHFHQSQYRTFKALGVTQLGGWRTWDEPNKSQPPYE